MDAARTRAIDKFRDGSLQMLIATDVLALGLDFLGVRTVFNYDVPTSAIAYVHRIGGTGRNARSGEANTLFTEKGAMHLPRVLKMAKASGAEVPEWALGLKIVTHKRKVEKLEKFPSRSKRLGGSNAPVVSDRAAEYRMPGGGDGEGQRDDVEPKTKKRRKNKRAAAKHDVSLDKDVED